MAWDNIFFLESVKKFFRINKHQQQQQQIGKTNNLFKNIAANPSLDIYHRHFVFLSPRGFFFIIIIIIVV